MSTADDDNRYGYTPTKSVCLIFVVLFGISTLIHCWQVVRSRAWFLIPTVVLAGAAEVFGWVARTKSSSDPTVRSAYILQATILVLAPTPLVAALFVGFGRVVDRLGAQYSRLSPRWYSRIFLTCDVLSLLIQGGGGGIAAASNNPSKARLGSNIILVGLVVQLISMTTFCYFIAEYAWRRAADRPFRKAEALSYNEMATPPASSVLTSHMKQLVIGICVSSVFIYIRSVYRVVEFSDGFNGKIAHTQVLFNVLDGAMITLAMYTLNFMHPGMLLKTTGEAADYALADRNNVSFSQRTSPTVLTSLGGPRFTEQK